MAERGGFTIGKHPFLKFAPAHCIYVSNLNTEVVVTYIGTLKFLSMPGEHGKLVKSHVLEIHFSPPRYIGRKGPHILIPWSISIKVQSVGNLHPGF
jgi:hypothetical protein